MKFQVFIYHISIYIRHEEENVKQAQLSLVSHRVRMEGVAGTLAAINGAIRDPGINRTNIVAGDHQVRPHARRRAARRGDAIARRTWPSQGWSYVAKGAMCVGRWYGDIGENIRATGASHTAVWFVSWVALWEEGWSVGSSSKMLGATIAATGSLGSAGRRLRYHC
jgi:hypothetical protein